MNDAIAAIFAGKGTPEGIVDGHAEAAKSQ